MQALRDYNAVTGKRLAMFYQSYGWDCWSAHYIENNYQFHVVVHDDKAFLDTAVFSVGVAKIAAVTDNMMVLDVSACSPLGEYVCYPDAPGVCRRYLMSIHPERAVGTSCPWCPQTPIPL